MEAGIEKKRIVEAEKHTYDGLVEAVRCRADEKPVSDESFSLKDDLRASFCASSSPFCASSLPFCTFSSSISSFILSTISLILDVTERINSI